MLPNRVAVIVPSRGRPDRWESVSKVMPFARLCVDEREKEAYAAVPKDKIVWHPPTDTIGQVRQWILDNVKNECVVMVDDDIRCIRPLCGKHRGAIRDAGSFETIIRNGWQVARDLGLSIFCWNRNPNAAFFHPQDPIHFVSPAAGAFGIVGRKFKFDTSLIHGEDVDMTMQALRGDRVIYCDMRYYWDFGPVMDGKGGLQGIRTEERILKDIRTLEERWPGAVILSDKPTSATVNGTRSGKRSCRIRLKRRMPGAGK